MGTEGKEPSRLDLSRTRMFSARIRRNLVTVANLAIVDSCSKEAVFRRLLVEKNLTGPELAVLGDGKVEIALGREAGALTIGVASDEDKREGVNPVKRYVLLYATTFSDRSGLLIGIYSVGHCKPCAIDNVVAYRISVSVIKCKKGFMFSVWYI